MKFFTLGCIFFAAIAVIGCQNSKRSEINGTYTTKFTHANIPTSPEMAGTWEITFAGEGKFSLRREGLLIIQGEYSLSGDTLRVEKEVGVSACASTDPGVYLVSRMPAGLKLQLISEPCQGRAIVLAMFSLTKKES